MGTPITVAHGDGIGPEIMGATLRILESAGAALDIETIKVGKEVYESGNTTGIPAEAWESLRRTRVLLKAPITTPQGGGYKSLNVTIRKSMGLFANVRPCISYSPFVESKFPGMDLVIVRENEEDLYAGIEHQQTPEVTQCLKLISRPGSEKIVRYAFEYAKANGRKHVTCMSKDNIMKLSDGLFHKVFNEIKADYPDITTDHWIVDIGAAKVAADPTRFDVIVTLNLYGDIISDIAAEITGSVGLGGSANVGAEVAMFEAIHGSAPDIAGQGLANPSGLLLGAVMMLVHIGQPEVAEKVHNAWLKTIEDGIATGDIYREGVSKERVGTDGFADALIARLGQQPSDMAAVRYDKESPGVTIHPVVRRPRPDKQTIGVDIFLDWDEADRDPNVLGAKLEAAAEKAGVGLKLSMVSNRGVKVYPDGMPETFLVDHWRARFLTDEGAPITWTAILKLQAQVGAAGLAFIKTEHLCTFDGVPGFSLGQGQ